MKTRDERVNDRYAHRLAKDIYHALRHNLLDEKTLETFKWQRNRLAEYEKIALLDDLTLDDVGDAKLIKMKKDSDK